MRHGAGPLIMAVLLAWALPATGNVLQDPGFEGFLFDQGKGYHVLNPSGPWHFVTTSQAGVRFDASHWNAPQEMVDERPLGFSPGAMGYEGSGAEQNVGMILLRQDITPMPVGMRGNEFEAWVWLGGAGLDDGVGSQDLKEEYGGWEIVFYTSSNPAEWNAGTAIETHTQHYDYWGEPEGFVRVSGLGRVPSAAAGARFTAFATTRHTALPGANTGTRVALDNAHFGPVAANRVSNGDFTADAQPGEFRFWDHPDPWWNNPGGIQPHHIGGVLGDMFNHGTWLPYFNHGYVYGYDTWLNGEWVNDSFSFGQVMNMNVPTGTQLALSFYWIQFMKSSSYNADLRRPLGTVDIGIEYFQNETSLDVEYRTVNWPVASHPNNVNHLDQNGKQTFHPRLQLWPPEGTNRLGLHIKVNTYAFPPARELFTQLVDNFHLSVVSTTGPSPTPTHTPVQGQPASVSLY